MVTKMLNEKQYQLMDYVAEGKTNIESAELLGVHRNTISNWRRNPEWLAEYKRRVIERTHSRLPELLDAMMDEAINNGNAAMSKLLLQLNEMLTDKVEVESKSAGKGSNDIDAMRAEIERFRRENQ
jgi:hypothetical protein